MECIFGGQQYGSPPFILSSDKRCIYGSQGTGEKVLLLNSDSAEVLEIWSKSPKANGKRSYSFNFSKYDTFRFALAGVIFARSQ